MKKILILLAFLCVGSYSYAQRPNHKTYYSTGSEFIFSFPNVNNLEDEGTVMRFSAFFNPEIFIHHDLTKQVGFFSGLTLRNVGFIIDIPEELVEVPSQDVRKKIRTYNVGIPLALKFGALDRFHMYGGYELEFPINYKEKTFINESKEDKFNVWFSSRTTTFNHSFFVGFETPYGTDIKFKYYVSNFFDDSYDRTLKSTSLRYSDFDVNVFYVSLSFRVYHFLHGM
ncbi:hypothetical protein [Algivirga pacifica]|uniref:Outer membrane protein beta-barrel domain-containing protein n=1 Tax=Algivirga pacifica TaxID=1162670 RepID=A0ABP9DBH6_9BACT